MTQTTNAPQRQRPKKQRRLFFNRAVGALIITVGEGERAQEYGYWVDRLAHPDASARAVRMTKFTATRREGEPDSYDVVAIPSGAGSCECKGFLRWQHCKHLDALVTLLVSSRLD